MSKNSNKRFWIGAGITIIGAVVFVLCVQNVLVGLGRMEEAQQDRFDQFKREVGSKVVVDKDTLTIVNFNSFNETFILNNGMIIDEALLIKTKI